MRARARDLVSALAAPGGDERRLFARRLLEQRHLSFDSAAGRAAALQYLIDAVVRIATEQAAIDRELETARTAANPARQRDIGARIFRTRGLSLDTSLAPNYALDRALDMMKASGVLRVGAITRLAVIGPGLDFSDKDSGFDFYPQQTLQPFALLDSIGRLGVGTAADPEVVLLDISPRVIDHVTRATARAARGESYTVYLPLARHREWLPAFRAYWQRFGDQIGTPVQPAVPADISTAAELRAVRVRPQVVQRVSVADVNAVTDRLDGDGFDLMVATNVLVYYDAFDQALALANIAAMLRPGGILLSNNPLPDAPDAPLRLAGSSDTTYWLARSSGDGTPTTFGDRIFWYQRQR
jgi:SAM-dependent methyltransferase